MAEVLTLQEDGVVERRHGELLEGRGLPEVGVQPGRALHQGPHRLLWAAERLRRGGGLGGAAKVITGDY